MPNRGNHLWVAGRQAGVFLGAVRRVLRRVPRRHALPRDRARAPGVQRLAQRPDGCPPAGWPRRPARASPRRSSPPTAPSAATRPGYHGQVRRVTRSTRGAPSSCRPADEDPALIARGRELFAVEDLQELPHDPRRRLHRGRRAGAHPRRRPARRSPRGLLENNRDELHRWIHAPNEVKPGNKMWVSGYIANAIKLTPEDEDALVELPGEPQVTRIMEALAKSDFLAKGDEPAKPFVLWRPTAKTGLMSWLTTVDHKRIGFLYGISGALLLRLRRDRGAAHPHPARGPEQHLPHVRAVQRDVHDARHDDDLPGRHADRRRVLQLHHAAADRGARRGLPAAERVLVLDLPGRRDHPQPRLVHEGRGARRRLVRLRPAHDAARSARPTRSTCG